MSLDKTKKVDLAGAQALVQDTIRRFKTECVILDNSGDIIISSDSSFASGTSGSTKTKVPATQYEKLLIHTDGSLWVKTGTDSSSGDDKTIWTCRGRVHVAPTSTEVKGALGTGSAVSSQTQSTKFLREDGSWAAPSYTANDGNTTYSLGVGTGTDANKIVLTPSSGTADKITVPYATAAGDATTVNGKTVNKNVPSDAVFTDTTYESKAAANGGTAVSLVTTGEKYTWNQKQDALSFMSIPSSSNKVATASNIPSSLPANGGNAATVNNHTVNSDVPANAIFTDTTYSTMVASGSSHAGGLVPDPGATQGATKFLREDGTWNVPAFSVIYGTTAGTACEGNDSRLSDARVARNQIASYTAISANQSNVTTSLTEDGSEAKVYYNSGSSAVTVSFASSGLTFVDGNDNMEIPAGGVGEVNFLRVTTSGTTRVFVRSVTSDDSVTVNTVS